MLLEWSTAAPQMPSCAFFRLKFSAYTRSFRLVKNKYEHCFVLWDKVYLKTYWHQKSFRLNVCIGHLTATVTALIREQKDTTSHPYFTSCYLLCFWPIPLLQPDPIYRSLKLCVYSMLIAPQTDQSSKSPQFHHYLPWETGWEAHLPTRASQADSGGSRGGRRPCTSTCTDSLAWVCFCDVL